MSNEWIFDRILEVLEEGPHTGKYKQVLRTLACRVYEREIETSSPEYFATSAAMRWLEDADLIVVQREYHHSRYQGNVIQSIRLNQ